MSIFVLLLCFETLVSMAMNGSFMNSLEKGKHFGAVLEDYLGTLLVGLKPHSYGQEL